jgi:energy-coupling factor transporter transmembrane protein EcfT
VAELSAFTYRFGRSQLHALDVRCKLAAFVAVCLAAAQAGWAGLALLTACAGAAWFSVGLAPRIWWRELRYVLMLLALVFAARAVSTPGEILGRIGAVSVTRQGFISAALVCWRLGLIVSLGVCFMTTTRPAQVRAAAAWLLRPVPLIPAQRVATMLGLLLRFIPLVLEKGSEIKAAQCARGIENRKNPVYRITCFSQPLLRRTFLTADELALAMAARGYTEQPADRPWALQRRDGFLLAAALLLALAAVAL